MGEATDISDHLLRLQHHPRVIEQWPDNWGTRDVKIDEHRHYFDMVFIECHRDPDSPKLRMVSWNPNTMRFGGDWTPQSSFENMTGFLGMFDVLL